MEFTIDATDRTDAPAERQVISEGTHVLEIAHAEEGPNSYKIADNNPEGWCLKLRLTKGSEYRYIFDDLPQHLGWRAKQLAAALGIEPDGDELSIDADSLVGRSVKVLVEHYTSKAGRLSAVVKKYLPADKDEPQSRLVAAASKKMGMKAVKLDDDDDDVPF